MHGKLMRLAILQVLIGLGVGVAGQSPDAGKIDERLGAVVDALHDDAPPLQAAKPVVTSPVRVPEGNGAPVITDGLFSPGEWDDALRIALSETVELRLKRYRGVVYIGVRGLNTAGIGIGPSELFLAAPGGQIHKLHVSAQLHEVVLPPTGAEPPSRFGLTPDWYANELRRDMMESQRLEKEGKSPFDIIRATSYPSDGIEFAIRRSKFPGQRYSPQSTPVALPIP